MSRVAPGACPPLPVSPPPRCPEDPHSARPPVSTAAHDPFPRPPTLARKLAGARRLAGRVPAGRPAGKGPGAVWGAQGGRPQLPLGSHSVGRRGVLPAPRWRGPVGGEGREQTSFSWGRRRAPRPRGERPPRTSRRPAGSPRGRAGGGRRLLAAGLGRAALSPGSGLPCRVLFALLLRASPQRRRQPGFPVAPRWKCAKTCPAGRWPCCRHFPVSRHLAPPLGAGGWALYRSATAECCHLPAPPLCGSTAASGGAVCVRRAALRTAPPPPRGAPRWPRGPDIGREVLGFFCPCSLPGRAAHTWLSHCITVVLQAETVASL